MPNLSVFLAAIVTSLLVASCTGLGTAWNAGMAERSAQGQIMLVSDNPSTLGARRIDQQSRSYPDMRKFLDRSGRPDFVAETTNAKRRYLILYYLDHEHAFAARTRRPDDGTMEFAGPYPITENETKLLSERKRLHQEHFR